jgi:excisionase family DNA binding protein
MSISSTGLSHHELHGAKPLTITISTAKRLSGLGNTTIWKLIKEKKLETVHVGRRTLITFWSLEALLRPRSAGEVPLRRRGRPRKRAQAHEAETGGSR